MKELSSLIWDYEEVFYTINIIELIVGLAIMVLAPNKKLHKFFSYIIGMYTGVGIGSIIGFRMSYTVAGMLIGMGAGFVIALIILIGISRVHISVVCFVVFFKIALIAFALWHKNDVHTVEVVLSIIIAGVISVTEYAINIRNPITGLYSKYLIGIFGTLEAAAAIVCYHRYDLTSIGKFLTMKDEYCNFFTYILKVDLTIPGQMDQFMLMLVFLFEMEAIFIFLVNKTKEERKIEE